MRQLLFMSLAAEHRVSCWEIDPSDGRLGQLSNTEIAGGPAPLAADLDRSLLYVDRRDIPQVSSYRIDSSTGSLKHLSDGPVLNSDPCYISLDKTGRFLLGAHYNGGGASVHGLVDGRFEGRSDWIPTGAGAHCIMTDAANRYAMLPHIAGEKGINTIRLFSFNEESGQLISNDPPECSQPDNRGPRHYCFHPNGRYVYFTNEQECSVTVYSYDPNSGTIKEVQTQSTLPISYAGHNHCAQLRITPNGKFLYAPNRGHDSLAAFSVDEDTGMLTLIGRTPTEAIPRVLDIDHTGQFLYSAGFKSGYVSAFRILTDGGLDLIDRYEVGREPMWILILPGE